MRGGLRRWIVAGAVGTTLGVGSAALALWLMPGVGVERVGPWASNPLTGARSADPYTRAFVARVGILALNRSETIYFDARSDSEGRRLDARCRYRLSGGPLPARWWSATVYAEDDFLPRNDDRALSVDADSVTTGPDGRWSATLAPERPSGGDWISTRRAGAFAVTLRLYLPEPEAAEDPTGLALPAIERLSCDGGAA